MKQKGVTLPKYKISLMQKLIIKGKKLNGTIAISGSKNVTLPILASILTNHTKLTNVPLVKDIFTMLELLKFIGMKVNINNKKIP